MPTLPTSLKSSKLTAHNGNPGRTEGGRLPGYTVAESPAVPSQQLRNASESRQAGNLPQTPRTPAWQAARRSLLIATGLVFTTLAGFGLVLPGLPTTPFLLLAAACFARSSPRLHAALLGSRLFGQHLQHWNKHRSITPAVRWWAIAFVIVGVSFSLYFGNLARWLEAVVTTAALIGLIVVFRLPVRSRNSTQDP